jgi:uncharacterized protein YaaN involved in tellurite resistance
MANTKSLSRAQQDYMARRIRDGAWQAQSRVNEAANEQLEMHPELTDKQKYDAIRKGKAKLRAFDEINSCCRDVYALYEYEDAHEQARLRITKRRDELKRQIEDLETQCKDKLYLGDASELVAMLAKFSAFKF